MNNTECSGCGALFECGVGEQSCWCMDTEPVEPVEGYGMKIYLHGCLCKDCLNAKINGYLSLDHLIEVAFHKAVQNMRKQND